MAITIIQESVPEGYLPLKEAATVIGLSSARTRYYVSKGTLASARDARNRIYVSEEAIDAFLANPPQRGRAATGEGGKRKTYSYTPAAVAQLKGARRQIRTHVGDSKEKATALSVIEELLDWRISEWQAAKDEDSDDVAVEL